MAIVLCPDCSGLIDDEKTKVVRFAYGDPPVEEARVVLYHVAFPPSRFEPIGLAPASCIHGVAEHPNPAMQNDPQLNRRGVTWIRSRYLDSKGRCPVCRGEPRPDDLTLGYVDPEPPLQAGPA